MASEPNRIHSACQSSHLQTSRGARKHSPASLRALIAPGKAEPDNAGCAGMMIPVLQVRSLVGVKWKTQAIECPILLQGVALGEAVPLCGRGWISHRRLRLVGIDRPVSEAPSMEVSSLLPPTVPASSGAVSTRSNGARNVVPRVAGVEFVADSTG